MLAGLLALLLHRQPDSNHLVDVVYGHKQGVALTMDVFKPAKASGIGVIWIVSGGWVSDHRNINPALAKVFTDRGMTVFEVVHGSQPRFQLPDILNDVHRAVRFIRANASTWSVDKNRLGISGGSAGGHLSLMIGNGPREGSPSARDLVERETSKIQAVACFFPPTDFLNWGKDGAAATDNSMLRPFYGAFGITDKTSKEQALEIGRSLSPILLISKSSPPTLIYHGDADTLVPLQQSQSFIAKLKAAGVPGELVVRAGKGHGYPETATDLKYFADWFEKYLPPSKG